MIGEILEMMELAEAVQLLYKLEYEVRREHVKKLPASYLPALYAQGFDPKKKYYVITRGRFEPKNQPLPKEIEVATEENVRTIFKACKLIHKMSNDSGREFGSFKERLAYARTQLPRIITEPPKDETDKSAIMRDFMETMGMTVQFKVKKVEQ